MNLEKEMEKLSKLQKSGNVTLQKHMNKMSDIFLSAENNSLMKENKARQQYEWTFDFYCRQAEELNIDLWVHLSNIFMISEERHLIKPPDTLKDKKKKQDWIKKEFWPYFYEYLFNCFLFKVTNKFSKGKGKSMDGGEIRGKQETQEKIEREEIIRQEAKYFNVKKLIDFGVKKKDIWELVTDSIPAEKKKKKSGIQYVRKFLKSLNYNP